MKITKEQLKRIIKEELGTVLEDQSPYAKLIQDIEGNIEDLITYTFEWSDDDIKDWLTNEMEERGIEKTKQDFTALWYSFKNAKRNFAKIEPLGIIDFEKQMEPLVERYLGRKNDPVSYKMITDFITALMAEKQSGNN